MPSEEMARLREEGFNQDKEVVGTQFKQMHSFNEKCDACEKQCVKGIHVVTTVSYNLNQENGMVNTYAYVPVVKYCTDCVPKRNKKEVMRDVQR